MSTTTTNRTARRRPSLRLSLLAATAGVALASAPARAAIEENYASGEPPITTTWFAPVSDGGAAGRPRLRGRHAPAPRGRACP